MLFFEDEAACGCFEDEAAAEEEEARLVFLAAEGEGEEEEDGDVASRLLSDDEKDVAPRLRPDEEKEEEVASRFVRETCLRLLRLALSWPCSPSSSSLR